MAVSDPGISGEACRPNTITTLADLIPAGRGGRWEIEVRQLVCSRQEDYRMQLEIMVFIRTWDHDNSSKDPTATGSDQDLLQLMLSSRSTERSRFT